MADRPRWARLFAVAGAMLVVACSGGGDAAPSPTTAVDAAPVVTDARERATVDASASTSTVGAVAPTTEPARPDYDIAALLRSDPLIIMNVVPRLPSDSDLDLPVGMTDHDLLFEGGGDWERDRLGFYRIHAWQVRNVLTDEQLRSIFDFLDRNQIPLMFETEPLTYHVGQGCVHTESFSGRYDLEMAERIADLGGTIHAVAIEEPYHFVHKLDGDDNCQWPVERIVDGVIGYMDQIRAVFPDVPVGTIEPIWSAPATTPRDMEIWLDTWEERSGEQFAFLHVDPDWYRPDWPEVAVGIEAVADARGVPFGVLYNGGGLEPDGESWMQFTMENIAKFEEEHGGTPQHVSFQTWYDQPQRALPASDLGALTSGITRYFGDRTRLGVGVTASDLEIVLQTTDGAPVAGAELSVSARSLMGALGTRTVVGTVPDGVTEAIALVRVNAEGAGPGPADLRIADISFREVDGGELVDNGGFEAGTDGWGIYGDPSGDVYVDSGGGETWLAIDASADQQVFVDGEWFAVTPGAAYEFTARFGITDESVAAVSVSIEFPGVGRVEMDMSPPASGVVTATTDGDGRAMVPVASFERGSYEVGVEYIGDLDHWPATVSVPVEIG